MDVYNVWALSTCSESNANYWKYKLPRKSQRTNKSWGLLSHPNILHLVRAYYNLSSMVAISVTSSLASTASVKVLFSTFFLVVISSFGHPLQNFLKPKELIILTSSVKLFSTILWKNGKQTIVHPNVYFDPTQTNVLMELKELIILTKSVKLFSIQLLGKKNEREICPFKCLFWSNRVKCSAGISICFLDCSDWWHTVPDLDMGFRGIQPRVHNQAWGGLKKKCVQWLMPNIILLSYSTFIKWRKYTSLFSHHEDMMK